jgi:catechol 2,3-dioxygenase-like lactoylglutathione lyase family enzyme
VAAAVDEEGGRADRVVSVELSILSTLEEGDEEDLDDVPDWQQNEVEIARAIVEDQGERFIDPPDKFDFNEYDHMAEFIDTIRDRRIAGELARAIQGSGAFRRFKDALHHFGIQEQWFEHRARAMKEFVIEWAKENEVEYEDDFPFPLKHSKPLEATIQTLGGITLLVRDYDEALEFFTKKLGFIVVEDTRLNESKRWLLVAPLASVETSILLARATTPEQISRIGNQAGGRVFLFLHTTDFQRDYEAMKARGVKFIEKPREEMYGTVAVFEDLYGNKWDLIEPKFSENV